MKISRIASLMLVVLFVASSASAMMNVSTRPPRGSGGTGTGAGDTGCFETHGYGNGC